MKKTLIVPTMLTLSIVFVSNGIALAQATNTSSASNSGVLSRKYSGTKITVLLPPWAEMPQHNLVEFTQATGIKVNMEYMTWDDIHSKIITSEAAGVAPADVTEFDWSWVGQFAAANWYTPLQKLIPQNEIKNSLAASTFTVSDNLLAMPYNWGARETVLNWSYFKKAGITKVPRTWAQLIADAKEIQKKGIVKYPMRLPMDVAEATSIAFYDLSKATGKQLFSSNMTPEISSPGSAAYQTLMFYKQLYDEKLVPPGEISMTYVQGESDFSAGQAAVLLAEDPGAMAQFENPTVSKVAKDDLEIINTPGSTEASAGITFVQSEGLGIPKLSTHQGAAAMFIAWWMQTPQQLAIYKDPKDSSLPVERYALDVLEHKNEIIGGKAVVIPATLLSPLFPKGMPTWYPQFSNAVSTMIQSVVEGKQSPKSALESLQSQTQQMENQ